MLFQHFLGFWNMARGNGRGFRDSCGPQIVFQWWRWWKWASRCLGCDSQTFASSNWLNSFQRIFQQSLPIAIELGHNMFQIHCYRWGISGAEMISASRRGSVADSAVRRTREIPPAAAVLWLIPPSAANAKFRQPPWICGWFRRPPRICGWFRRLPHTRNSASRRARMVGKDGLS